VRVYLPGTFPMLVEWLAAGAARPSDLAGVPAHAVTAALREWYHDADLDELEHAAQLDAAVSSLRLLALDPSAPRRRVVLAVDVEDPEAQPASPAGRSAITLDRAVPMVRWASALIDDVDAEPVVTQAVSALEAAAPGDDDAQFDIDEAEAVELGWYAVQELPHLLH